MIKLIIFDMDGTLYDLNDVVAQNYEMQVAYLQERWNKSRDEIETYFNDNSIYPTISMDSKSATELFLKNGLSRDDWNAFREQHFSATNIDISKAVSKAVLCGFANITKLVLLSSNSYNNIEKILTHLNIPLDTFDYIVCSDRFDGVKSFNKSEAMQLISARYSISYTDMLSIGDRYKTDILPMLELKGQGVLVSTPSSLRLVLKDLKEGRLATCCDYIYYTQI